MNFEDYRAKKILLVEDFLERVLPSISNPPSILHEAMRYSIFAGGKRLRSILALATGDIYFLSDSVIVPPASAIELIHTYSLIHDDLPAMDNDDFRRGKPTSHKKFGEAIAILSGDALLTYAFFILSKYPQEEEYAMRKVRVIEEVSKASGTPYGMVAGQVFDMENTDKNRKVEDIEKLHSTLVDLHSKKTGALISVAVKIGYIMGGATKKEEEFLDNYSKNIGIAFQIVDDVLDEISSQEKMGKRVKKDREEGKLTYPLLFGVEKSIEMAKEHVERAKSHLEHFGERGRMLSKIADFIVDREF